MTAKQPKPEWAAVGAHVVVTTRGATAMVGEVIRHTPTRIVVQIAYVSGAGNYEIQFTYDDFHAVWIEYGGSASHYSRPFLVDPNSEEGKALLVLRTAARHRRAAEGSIDVYRKKKDPTTEDVAHLIAQLQKYLKFRKAAGL